MFYNRSVKNKVIFFMSVSWYVVVIGYKQFKSLPRAANRLEPTLVIIGRANKENISNEFIVGV